MCCCHAGRRGSSVGVLIPHLRYLALYVGSKGRSWWVRSFVCRVQVRLWRHARHRSATAVPSLVLSSSSVCRELLVANQHAGRFRRRTGVPKLRLVAADTLQAPPARRSRRCQSSKGGCRMRAVDAHVIAVDIHRGRHNRRRGRPPVTAASIVWSDRRELLRPLARPASARAAVVACTATHSVLEAPRFRLRAHQYRV